LAKGLNSSDVPGRLAAEDHAGVPEAKGWPGLIAKMILRPAWVFPQLPLLNKAPEWLWADYAAWMLGVPKMFATPAQADRFAVFWENQLSELVRWVETNPAAAVVKAELDCYFTQLAFPALRLSRLDLRRNAELHARLISRLERKAAGKDQPPILLTREGRRLRVGFVQATFDGSPAMQAALPMIGHLDPDRFEVELFVLSPTNSRWEQYARTTVSQMQALPSNPSEQIRVISQAGLDVLVYATDLTGDRGDLIKLAAHRLAPLQVATSAYHAVTTGCAMIDLFVAGEQSGLADLTGQLSERVGLVPGPTRIFDQLTAAHSCTKQWNRSDIDLPEGAMVFVAAASWGQIGPEMQVLWAELLARLPDSRLLVQRIGPDRDGAVEAQQFCAAFDRILTAQGVTEDRLLVSPSALPSHADLEALFKIGNVFLDVCPSDDETAALSALKTGLPVISIGGPAWRSCRVATLLRSLGLSDLVVADQVEYAALALRLATDEQVRAAMAERIRHALATVPAVLDALALGDGFGDLIEVAFDDVLAVGSSAFRANSIPLRVPADAVSTSDHLTASQDACVQGDYFIALAEARSALRANPASLPARALLGRAYLGLDQSRRAAEYLSAAVETGEADATCWSDLARALKQDNQPEQAMQAIVTSLRLDPKVADGWLMLIEIAEAVGEADLARKAVDILGAMAPDHPRLEGFRLRFALASVPDGSA
jgi:predicted O-linked N-acetylglucosamine transferase (SPINDLY family)